MSVLYPVIEYLTGKQGQKVVLSEVMTGADRPRKPVLRALDKLSTEGWLEEVKDAPLQNEFCQFGPPRRNPTWKVIQDPADRPLVQVQPRKTTLRQKIWHLIRSKRRFTKEELVISSGAKYKTVDQYVRELEQGSHVRRTGKDGMKVTYMLITTKVKRPLPGVEHER